MRTCGQTFQYQGERFRFVGYNLRGICHYGTSRLPYSLAFDRLTNLDAARDQGIRVIRVFVSDKDAGREDVADRLGIVLDLCRARGLFVIATLTDFYIASDMWVRGDAPYYQTDGWGYTVLNAAWYTGGFEQNYWPQCALLVERFRDHEALFCWEVGNEMKLSENKPAFIAFMQTIRQRIRALDPNHMISTGMISTRHTGIDQNSAQADQLYAGFDIVSQHSYNESDADTQVQLAARLGKPLVIGEVGYDVRNYSTEGRNQALVRDLEKWFGRGVAGIMQWGFQAQTRDIGDGDRYVGMDRYSVTNSPHYPFYVQTYSGRASWLRANPPAGTPCPTVTPTPPPYQSLIEIR